MIDRLIFWTIGKIRTSWGECPFWWFPQKLLWSPGT
jgi:hypothetical protein